MERILSSKIVLCCFPASDRLSLLQTTARLHGERLLLHPHSLRLSGPGRSTQTPHNVYAGNWRWMKTICCIHSFLNINRGADCMASKVHLCIRDWLQTQLMYKWIEPKICSETVQGAVQLPESGAKQDCPPCNPGFFVTNSSTCEPCDKGFHSNGTGAGVGRNQIVLTCTECK